MQRFERRVLATRTSRILIGAACAAVASLGITQTAQAATATPWLAASPHTPPKGAAHVTVHQKTAITRQVRVHDRTPSGASPLVTKAARELRLRAHPARRASPAPGFGSVWTDWNNNDALYDWNNASGTYEEWPPLELSSDSSPGIADTSGNFVEDFNGQNGKFWVGDARGNFTYFNNMGVEPYTNTAIAQLSDGSYAASYENSGGSGYLSVYTSRNNTVYNFNISMFNGEGTGPAITGMPGGKYEAAYETPGGRLGLYSSATNSTTVPNLWAMDPWSSPSITALPSGGFEVVYEDSNNDLVTYLSTGSSLQWSIGLTAGTSPSIAIQQGSAPVITFTDNTADLGVFFPNADAWYPTGYDVQGSPALATVAGGGDVAYSSTPYDELSIFSYSGINAINSDSNTNSGWGDLFGTNPAITSIGT